MSIAPPKVGRLRLGPRSAGLLLTPAEFDRARFREGWRYELINGVLVVSPTPRARSVIPTISWDTGSGISRRTILRALAST